MTSGIISDANPLGLDGFDREIQPHEYSISPVSKDLATIQIAGSTVFGQNSQIISWATVCFDTCICQRCRATIHLGPPRKLMGRWEESLGRCFYWWAHHETPKLCVTCERRAAELDGALRLALEELV